MDSRDARRIRPVKYFGSKAEAERVARRYQEAGAQVTITYPGAVFGPHYPYLGDGLRRLRNILKGRYRSPPSGGYGVVDVRDVARVHAAVLQPVRGARRYLAGGTFVRFADLVAGLGAVTVPAGMLLPAGRAVQLVQRIVPVHIPVEFEGIYFNWCAARSDNTGTRSELGVVPRDLQVTLVDSVRWLFEQGHISGRQAGSSPPPDRAARTRPATKAQVGDRCWTA